MRKNYGLFIVLLIMFAMQSSFAANSVTLNGSTPYGSIQAAINASTLSTDVVQFSGTFTENVVVNKSLTLQGSGTAIIQNSTGIGISVSANGVTLQDFTVTNASNHGIYAGNVSNLTITNVTASGNGNSGIALQGITGTSVLSNITASNNHTHGVEIGNGCSGVEVNGGTFNSNGQDGVTSTGGGIAIYADATKSTNGTVILGPLSANTNKIAGIYITAEAGATLNGTRIGMNASGTNAGGTITLTDNGSTGTTYDGGAAIILYGPCTDTRIRANATRSTSPAPAYKSAGLIVVGTDGSVAHSPSGTIVRDCNLSGYNSTSPAATMRVSNGSTTLTSPNDVDASTGNSINGASTGFDVEDLLYHKVDDYSLGMFKGPGTTLYVSAASGSIQRGINIAKNFPALGITQINVQDNTYTENVTVNTSVAIVGQGNGTIVQPSSGIGIVVSANNVTLQDLKVTGASDHGIYAGNVTNLTMTNVTSSGNGTGNKKSGVALQNVTGTSVLTGVVATNNEGHGLEIGKNSLGVTVDGGTFSHNGLAGDKSTGGGIALYADGTDSTDRTIIKGDVTADSNTIAGVYITCAAGATIYGTRIGLLADGSDASGTITLNDNGSVNSGLGLSGGAAVVVYGPCTDTRIRANSTKSASLGWNTAGLVIVGTDASGSNSPSGTIVTNSALSGFGGSSPAATMSITDGSSQTLTCSNDVVASVGNTINGATTGYAVEDLLTHKMDNSAYGLFIGPGTELFVTPNSGSIYRAVNIANSYTGLGITKVNVEGGGSAYAAVGNIDVTRQGLIIEGENVTPKVQVGSYLLVDADGVKIRNLDFSAGAKLFARSGYSNIEIDTVSFTGLQGGAIETALHLAGHNITVKNVKVNISTVGAGEGIYITGTSSNITISGGDITASVANPGILVEAADSLIQGLKFDNLNMHGNKYGIRFTTSGSGKIDTANIGVSSALTFTDNTENVRIEGDVENASIAGKFTNTASDKGVVVTDLSGQQPQHIKILGSIFKGFDASNLAVQATNPVDSVDARNVEWDTTAQAVIAAKISGPVKYDPWARKPFTQTISSTSFTSFGSGSGFGMQFGTGGSGAMVTFSNSFTSTNNLFGGLTLNLDEYFDINIDKADFGVATVGYQVRNPYSFIKPTGGNLIVRNVHGGVNKDILIDSSRVYYSDGFGNHSSDKINGAFNGDNYNFGFYSIDSAFIYFQISAASPFYFVQTQSGSSTVYLSAGVSSTPQSATVNTAFTNALSVKVVNSSGDSVPNTTVWFRRPTSGASVTFSGTGVTAVADSASVLTDANGVATVTATANGTAGSYTVYAQSANNSSEATFSLTNTAASIAVKIKVFLEGPYNSGTMSTTLNSGNYIPLNSDQAYDHTTYGYTAKTVGSIPNADVVDWVLVELRSGTASGTKVESEPAFLLKDGSVVDMDGSSDVSFSTATAGDYYIVIRHRNHLAIMSAGAVTLPNASAYDFTTAQGQAFGTNPMVDLGSGVFGMRAGDANASALVTGADANAIFAKFNQVGYYIEDTNLSALISGSDANLVYSELNNASQLP